MSYPVVNKLEAKRIVRARRLGQDVSANIGTKHLGSGADWDQIVAEVRGEFASIQKQVPDPDKDGGGRKFEIHAGRSLHELLPAHPALADAEFWTWLAAVEFPDIVDWRYGENGDVANFGGAGAQENFLYRLWLRADIGFEPDQGDPYGLASVGDIDFWRSHIFRQGYAEGREFARAFIRFQFPESNSGKPVLKIDDIRALAKRLKKARSNTMVEVLDEARASHFIQSEWAKLSAE